MDPAVDGAEDSTANDRVLDSVTHAIERLVERNDRISRSSSVVVEAWPEDEDLRRERRLSGRGLAAFQCLRPPAISIGNYLQRIQKYTKCSSSCFVVGYVYIDRAAHRNPSSPVVSLNVHRLILTSVLIASKFLDDMHHNNAFFARVGGVSNAELNRMELELLFLLDFGVMVTSRIFDYYCRYLEKEMTLSENKGVVADDSEANGITNLDKFISRERSAGRYVV